jgi:hypothetical protein
MPIKTKHNMTPSRIKTAYSHTELWNIEYDIHAPKQRCIRVSKSNIYLIRISNSQNKGSKEHPRPADKNKHST